MFGKPTVDEVHEAWCKALVKKALPLDLVDDSEFREAIKATAKCGTTYTSAATATSNCRTGKG